MSRWDVVIMRLVCLLVSVIVVQIIMAIIANNVVKIKRNL